MLKKSFILLAVMLCFIGRSLAQDRTKLNYEKKLNIIRERAGVDSLTATRVLAIEERYKASVARLMLTGLIEKDLRKGIDELIRAKNMELGKLLSKDVLLSYLPTNERIQLDPASASSSLSRHSLPKVVGKKAGDTVSGTAIPARKKAVYDIAASYEVKIERLRNGKLDARSKATELKRLEAERNEKIAKFLSAQINVEKDKKN